MDIGQIVTSRQNVKSIGKVTALKTSQHKKVLVQWQNGLEFWYDKISLKVIENSIKREVKS
jgi:hypothetical protein